MALESEQYFGKITMKGIAFACALAMGLGVCAAADAKKPASPPRAQKWDREPDGFLGIKFGAPLSVQQCPKQTIANQTFVDFGRLKTIDGLCIDGDSSYGQLWNTPELGLEYRVWVTGNDGAPTSFLLKSAPKDFDALSAAFISRYGPPTNRATSAAQTIGGASFRNVTLQWRGERVRITMQKYGDRVDQSETSVADADYWRARERARADEAAAGVGKL
ncbi:hypothetical protein WK57_30260 [Burkholderia ubonensis]|uniref:Uncharacterized protein n=2 Tax=Burkholderia ubonensis TaxID=101571 RepID=A0AA40R4Y9_9BURK|nr:hypothetical protein WK57_30260 [Burkholderia ubonensis]